jgi:hypothetical protein
LAIHLLVENSKNESTIFPLRGLDLSRKPMTFQIVFRIEFENQSAKLPASKANYNMPKPVDLRLHGVKFADVVKRMISAPQPSKPARKKTAKSSPLKK